jgi:hypothetical protein
MSYFQTSSQKTDRILLKSILKKPCKNLNCIRLCEILGFHSGAVEVSVFLGHGAALLGD